MVSIRGAREADLERLIEVHGVSYPDERSAAVRRANFTDNALGKLGDLRVAVDSKKGSSVTALDFRSARSSVASRSRRSASRASRSRPKRAVSASARRSSPRSKKRREIAAQVFVYCMHFAKRFTRVSATRTSRATSGSSVTRARFRKSGSSAHTRRIFEPRH